MDSKEKIFWHNKEVTVDYESINPDSISPNTSLYYIFLSVVIEGERFRGYASRYLSREEAITEAIVNMENDIINSSQTNLQILKYELEKHIHMRTRTTEIATNLVKAFNLKVKE